MIDRILRFRVIIIVLLIILTVPIGYQITNLTLDTGISALVPESHPEYKFSNLVEEQFGAMDQIVIGITTREGVFTRDALKLIYELTLFYEEMDEIEEDDVISITNINDMQGKDGELIIEPLVDEDIVEDLNEKKIKEIRERVRSNPLFRGKLVSEDEKSAVVLVGVPTDLGMKNEPIAKLKAESLQKLSELKQKYPDISFDFSGPAMLKAYISEYMQRDLRKLFPLAIVTVAFIILILLRSFFGMLIPILVTVFAVIWTFGLKGLLGSPITIVETAVPVVLIAIGCADGIHIISEFLTEKRKGVAISEAVKRTMILLTVPVVLTSLTTGLGFVSLITAPGVSIRNMGVFLAFGVMIAMVFSLLFVPSLISFFRRTEVPQNSKHTRSPDDNTTRTFEVKVETVGWWLLKRKFRVVSVALILLALSIFGILNIVVESDEVRYLRPNNEFRKATENIQKSLGGITSLDIVIQGSEKDQMKQPAMLKAIEELQQFCEEDELVSYSLSLADLLKRINYVMHDNDKEYDRLPGEVETIHRMVTNEVNGQTVRSEKVESVSGFLQIAQFLFLYEMSGGDSTDTYVDSDYKMTKVALRLKDMSSKQMESLLEKLDPYLKEHFPDDVTIRYANHYMRVVMMGLIIDSQIYSLLTVLATIAILMSIMFRSPTVGIFTALPVFTAVLFNFAIMWMFDVTLNIGTSIIASVGMGVGIDYSIHYFTRFRRFLKEGVEYDKALARAIADTSRAILSNATAVGVGFLVLLFSEYGVIANVGWIVAVSMVTTALGSLIVLPSLLAIFKPAIK